MEKTKVIQFKEFIPEGETSLVGRENGHTYSKKLSDAGIKFEEIENNFEEIIIEIPNTIMSMNKSFFLGIWADRVCVLGEDKFIKKYIFKTSEHIKNKIKKHIKAALLEATQEDILNVSAKS